MKIQSRQYIANLKSRFISDLKYWCNQHLSTSPLREVVDYSLFPSGKLLRPLLVLSVGQSFNVSYSRLWNVAAAVELLHVYTLVHDDIMDDDDYRRDRLSAHVFYDQSVAILLGDALQAEAVGLIGTSSIGSDN